MKFKKLLVLSIALLPFAGFSFEINTHQAITVCALSNKCLGINEQQGAQNLNYFAHIMKLDNVDYKSQIFRHEPKEFTYFNFAKKGKGLGEQDENNSTKGKQIGFAEGKTYLKNAKDKDGNIILGKDGKPSNLLDYADNSYISLIEAGSILEDALYPHPDPVKGGDGRFNNHFYSAQFYWIVI